mmetsp:Transcript_20788/g.34396  ORF Transcript_20788/g.34396 Transcript_20788/m.34396 type:complete len:923 (+) Transcript_20788:576-3344(+)
MVCEVLAVDLVGFLDGIEYGEGSARERYRKQKVDPQHCLSKETVSDIRRDVYCNNSDYCAEVEQILLTFMGEHSNRVFYSYAFTDIAFKLFELLHNRSEDTLVLLDFVVMKILRPFFLLEHKENDGELECRILGMLNPSLVGVSNCTMWIRTIFLSVFDANQIDMLWSKLFEVAQMEEDGAAQARMLLFSQSAVLVENQATGIDLIKQAITRNQGMDLNYFLSVETKCCEWIDQSHWSGGIDPLVVGEHSLVEFYQDDQGVKIKSLNGVVSMMDDPKQAARRVREGDVVISINGRPVNNDLAVAQTFSQDASKNALMYIQYERQQQQHHALKREDCDDMGVGETMLLDAVSCTYVIREALDEGEVRTTLRDGHMYITCYRVVFVPEGRNLSLEKRLTEDCREELHLPLLCISEINQLHMSLQIQGKDIRRLEFRFEDALILQKVLKTINALACNDPIKRASALANKEEYQGWSFFDPLVEFQRMGIDEFPKLSIFKQPQTFTMCQTYPRILVVPGGLPKKDLIASRNFRSQGRLPVVTWINTKTRAILARCAQPLAGLRNSTCAADEKLVVALMNAGDKDASEKYLLKQQEPSGDKYPLKQPPTADGVSQFVSDVWSKVNGWSSSESKEHPTERKRAESGQVDFIIMDARSQIASMGNQVLGKGTENPANYPGAKIEFLNIDNIHTVRASFAKVAELTSPSFECACLYRSIADTGWLKQVESVLDASVKLARALSSGTSVLTHCSDGWDRTSQMCSMAMLLLDPYYRSTIGFAVLIEKEWCSFGHKFKDRCGNAPGTPGEEVSPVFVLWVDCVWQVMVQFPNVFQFNESFLIALLDHVTSGRYGTFLFNCERTRTLAQARKRTTSVWSHLVKDTKRFQNPSYTPWPSPVFPRATGKMIRFWERYYFRYDSSFPSRCKQANYV